MAASERGYGGVRGRRAVYSKLEAKRRRNELASERYRTRTIAKQKHPAHRCYTCRREGHNARTCPAAKDLLWTTSERRG
jgi:hypothetical protein